MVMQPDYEKRLESRIDAELKGLGELRAPGSLAERVLNGISRRAAAPWYRRDWEAWPTPLRVGSIAVLLAAFAATCAGTWRFTNSPTYDRALQEAGNWLSPLALAWKTLALVFNSLCLAIKSVHPAILFGAIALLFLAYGMCFGLGTLYVRFAMARHHTR
jgi:hypothetical protein